MNKLEAYRAELNREIERQNGDLSHPRIIEISCMLDKYIVKEMIEAESIRQAAKPEINFQRKR